MAYIIFGVLALAAALAAFVWFGLTDDEKAKFSFFVEEILGKVWSLCAWVWEVVTYIPRRLFAFAWDKVKEFLPWLK